MKNIQFLIIGLLFIISCGKESLEPEIPVNPNLRTDVTSILFQTGEVGTDCEFVITNNHNNNTEYYIARGLHDTLKVDYKRMKVTYMVTSEIIECEHDHPDFQVSKDNTTFLIADIIEAEAF